uniref:Uncharacterized protein n=1 Tax=Anguilla anguilla TaxID=7936 RepID=A0A0E9WBB6_ANGAN
MPFAFRIRNECFRSALAETLSTYVMMVRRNTGGFTGGPEQNLSA